MSRNPWQFLVLIAWEYFNLCSLVSYGFAGILSTCHISLLISMQPSSPYLHPLQSLSVTIIFPLPITLLSTTPTYFLIPSHFRCRLSCPFTLPEKKMRCLYFIIPSNLAIFLIFFSIQCLSAWPFRSVLLAIYHNDYICKRVQVVPWYAISLLSMSVVLHTYYRIYTNWHYQRVQLLERGRKYFVRHVPFITHIVIRHRRLVVSQQYMLHTT